LAFLLAHLSDPHIGPLPNVPLRHLLNKRLTGVLNWHRARSTIHNMPVLAAIAADIAAGKPDHIALTGDLVNIGYAPEFPQALAMIEALGPPENVSIVPGNHDAYVRNSLPAMTRSFAAHMLNDGANGPVRFPYLRQRDGIALIGVNSGVPTLPFMATGAVGRAQRDRLADLLDETARQGLYRVVMIHHPPIRSAARFGRGLRDAEAFTAVLARHGAELVLHGHNHRHSLHFVPSVAGDVPVLGVASASAVPGTPHHLAEYHQIRIDPAARSCTVTRRGITGENREIRDIDTVFLSAKTS
jgi:3',5'-cyclic AMP phosphodiesterase CpdA